MSGLKVYQCQSILSICFLLCCKLSYAQELTSVYFVSEEGDNIQFAYAYLNQDSLSGMYSDIDGKISFASQGEIVVTVNHPDYHSQTFNLINEDSLVFTLNYLENREIKYPGMHLVNPAFYLVEKVVSNERLHDPERQGGSFRYKTYNKTLVDLYQLADHKLSAKYKEIVQGDSLFHKHHKFYGQQHVEVIESIDPS